MASVLLCLCASCPVSCLTVHWLDLQSNEGREQRECMVASSRAFSTLSPWPDAQLVDGCWRSPNAYCASIEMVILISALCSTNMVLWVELCPHNRHAEVLALGTCDCDLLWKSSLCRCHQVKVRSLGAPKFSITGVFIRKRKCLVKMGAQGEDRRVTTEAGSGVLYL